MWKTSILYNKKIHNCGSRDFFSNSKDKLPPFKVLLMWYKSLPRKCPELLIPSSFSCYCATSKNKLSCLVVIRKGAYNHFHLLATRTPRLTIGDLEGLIIILTCKPPRSPVPCRWVSSLYYTAVVRYLDGTWGSAGRETVLCAALFSCCVFSLMTSTVPGQVAYCLFTSVSSCNRVNITVG